MTKEISSKKVKQIAAAAGLSEDITREWLFADWPEGDEHLEWMAQAKVTEIASWLKAVYVEEYSE